MTRPDPTSALHASSACRELFAQVAEALGCDPVLDGGPDDIPDVGVIDPTTGDVIGAGRSLDDALAEALATVRGWAQ